MRLANEDKGEAHMGEAEDIKGEAEDDPMGTVVSEQEDAAAAAKDARRAARSRRLATRTEQSACHLRRILSLIRQWLAERNGSRVPEGGRLALLAMLGECLQATLEGMRADAPTDDAADFRLQIRQADT